MLQGKWTDYDELVFRILLVDGFDFTGKMRVKLSRNSDHPMLIDESLSLKVNVFGKLGFQCLQGRIFMKGLNSFISFRALKTLLSFLLALGLEIFPHHSCALILQCVAYKVSKSESLANVTRSNRSTFLQVNIRYLKCLSLINADFSLS
jgi:hypothetical protein